MIGFVAFTLGVVVGVAIVRLTDWLHCKNEVIGPQDAPMTTKMREIHRSMKGED